MGTIIPLYPFKCFENGFFYYLHMLYLKEKYIMNKIY